MLINMYFIPYKLYKNWILFRSRTVCQVFENVFNFIVMLVLCLSPNDQTLKSCQVGFSVIISSAHFRGLKSRIIDAIKYIPFITCKHMPKTGWASRRVHFANNKIKLRSDPQHPVFSIIFSWLKNKSSGTSFKMLIAFFWSSSSSQVPRMRNKSKSPLITQTIAIINRSSSTPEIEHRTAGLIEPPMTQSTSQLNSLTGSKTYKWANKHVPTIRIAAK